MSGVGPVDQARADLLGQLQDLSGQLRSTHEAVSLLPPMLGADGPRRYMVAFQNNAEARGSGGLPGVYAVVRADRGRVSFDHYGVTSDFSGIEVSLKGLSPGYASHYWGPASPGRVLRQHHGQPALPRQRHPPAAVLEGQDWRAARRRHCDRSPRAGDAARGDRPSLPRRRLDGGSVQRRSADRARRLPAFRRPAERKLYLIGVAKAVADDLLERGPQKGTQLASALGKAVGERRLLVYSTHAAEQRVLATRRIGGALSDTDGLFFGVVINNGGGNKLDYYLAREVTYEAAPCSSPTPSQATVTITLTNRAPKSGLTDYVAGRADRLIVPVSKGTNRVLVGYYATKGAGFSGATLDGKTELLAIDSEQGRPVFTSALEIAPGQTRVLRLTIDEPPQAKGPVSTLVQPLVLPQKTVVRAPSCPAADAR